MADAGAPKPRVGRLRTNQDLFIFHCEYVTTFLGCAALNLLLYALVSNYWFMINPRLNLIRPETRVLGLRTILESQRRINLSLLFKPDALGELTHKTLTRKVQRMCDDWQYLIDQDENAECGIDCQDMRFFKNLKVPCTIDQEGKDVFPIPIHPAERVAHCHRHQVRMDMCDEATKTACNMILRYHCYKKPEEDERSKLCPIGYKECSRGKRLGQVCPAKPKMNQSAYRDFTCCVDQEVLGKPLFNVTQPPTYVQVFGYMRWQLNLKRAHEGVEPKWCSVSQFRCNTIKAFKASGDQCQFYLIAAGAMLAIAVGLGFSKFRRRFILFSAVCYLVAGLLCALGMHVYEAETETTLKQSMTQVDEWGRPYLHPFSEYTIDELGPEPASILGEPSSPNNDAPNPEWMYFASNARVDFTAHNPEFESGYRTMWGFRLGKACYVLCVIASLACMELFFAFKNASPLIGLLQLCALCLCAVPYVCRIFIDNYLAPYPVLWIYPWQKLYPKAFTVGTWLPQPFDTLFDCGLMMPVHICRALWDYVSCQDICSPQEKKVLAKKGIINDRLQSLLCSRRSYFVMMAGMGIWGFFVKLHHAVGISEKDMKLRQAISEEVSYPIYRCKLLNGDCASGLTPDLYSLSSYLHHMAWRVLAIIEEGCNNVTVRKALTEWLANFVGVCCACGAVANWTDFKQSRRFCLIGWLIICVTPVMTCALSEVSSIKFSAVEEAISVAWLQTWEDVRAFADSDPCPEYKKWTEESVAMGETPCRALVALTFWKRGGTYKNGCKRYLADLKKYRDSVAKGDTDPWAMEKICQSFVTNIKVTFPTTRRAAEALIDEQLPAIMDGVQVFVGARAGLKNMLGILPAVASMVPGLMQGGLMFKNVVPRQTLPAILTTLPWAFTTVFWAQYQAVYQILSHKLLLVAALAMSFCPLVYYVYGKIYNLVQPMDDQQSITVTFRLWYYALIFALVLPYAIMGAYVLWINQFQEQLIWDATVGSVANDLAGFISSTLMMYAYTLQAGIDWFVDEIVDTHVCQHAPAVIALTQSKEEADVLQERMCTSLDTESIMQGTYVCGGLSDPNMLEPPKEGEWNYKAQVYVCSLANKDAATLDAFAGHIRHDERLPDILRRARAQFWVVMENPPRGIYVWDERTADELEEEVRQCRGGKPQIIPATAKGLPPDSVEMSAKASSASPQQAGAFQPMQQMRQPLQQQMQSAPSGSLFAAGGSSPAYACSYGNALGPGGGSAFAASGNAYGGGAMPSAPQQRAGAGWAPGAGRPFGPGQQQHHHQPFGHGGPGAFGPGGPLGRIG